MSRVLRLAFCTALAVGSSWAQITLETSAAALGANDTVTWGQLGGDSTALNSTFSATSANLLSVGGSFATTGGQVVDVGTSWGPASGAFSNGDAVVWALDSGTGFGTGPVTFTFASSYGAGAAVQADALGAFTASLQLFAGANSLGTVTETSLNGDAIFIGALNQPQLAGLNGQFGPSLGVTSAVFSLTSVTLPATDLGDFAVNTLNLNEQISSTPEPGSVVLLAGGLVGLGLLVRRRAICR